jgi:hypothetical protein
MGVLAMRTTEVRALTSAEIPPGNNQESQDVILWNLHPSIGPSIGWGGCQKI